MRGCSRNSDGPRIRNRPRALSALACLPRLRACEAGEVLMTANGWLRILLFLAVVIALTKPDDGHLQRAVPVHCPDAQVRCPSHSQSPEHLPAPAAVHASL